MWAVNTPGPSTIHKLSIAVVVVLALGLSVESLSGVSPVSANGATRTVVERTVGPYWLQVGILPGIPTVGILHLSIIVQDAENETVITDASVLVSAQGPAGSAGVAPVQAVNTPLDPESYEVDIPLDTAGSWTVTLETDGRLGKASLDLPMEVVEPDGLPAAWMAAGLAAFLALIFWTWRRSRRGGL